MDRNSKAALSPQELSALRRLRVDPGHPISLPHRQLFLLMALIFARGEQCWLTDAGRGRLTADDAECAHAAVRRA